MKYCTVCKTKYDDSVSFCSVDGEVLEADPASLVDTVLDGQYQMEALLGRGGMGAVYRARHILLGDRVAIKVLPPEVRTNAEWLRRFRREGQAARRFRHPNAVTVYDLRTAADGTIYMVMEYVEGNTLGAELKKRGRLSAREALEFLTPIMSVLDTAHSMGVVHRDLKPENIMIGNSTGGEPIVKLLDLGIAKMREIAGAETSGNTALTMAGQVLGTPYYMSPEQWGEIPRDGNIEIDGRADIYSLGLVFYELIAGRRCYAANTLHELRREHVSVTPKPLAEVVTTVPKGFSDAIQKATEKDRADRQPTAAVLAEELKAGLETAAQGGFAQASGNLAETMTITPAKTDSDLNAPTVIGLDASATSVPVGASPTSARAQAVAEVADNHSRVPDQTVVESASMVSSITLPSQPSTSSAGVLQPPRKSKAGLVIALVAVVVLLAVAGIGGVFVYSKLKTTPPTPATTQVTTTTNVEPVEISRYWLMLEPADEQANLKRVAGLDPVASGQTFQMHFVFAQPGYVYIYGPGDNNKPTAFLTVRPSAETGLKTNYAAAGAEFSFPSGDKLLSLDKKPGTDRFTVIFSKLRLESPSFLSLTVNGDPLTTEQLAEFDTFVSKYSKVTPSIELDESNNQKPFVRVKGNANQSEEPFVFEVRIQHN